MKVKVFLLLIFSFSDLYSQSKVEFSSLPFDIEALRHFSYRKDSIMPKFIAGKFYYVNIRTDETISDTGFDAAYPFAGRTSTIIKSNGKFGIIDRKGNLLVEPVFRSFQLRLSAFGDVFVAFGGDVFVGGDVFDLQKGEYVRPYMGCIYPVRESVFYFKGKNSKYGITKRVSEKKYKVIFKPMFDSVYLIRRGVIVAKKKGRIGVISEYKTLLLPFDYSDIVISKPFWSFVKPDLIGLKNKEVWEYYRLQDNPVLIMKSEFECRNIGRIRIKGGFGIYSTNGKYNILFSDGTSMEKEYDWISDDGTVAIDENQVYILGDDGIPFLYYEVK